MEEIDINSIEESSSITENTETDSEINKCDLISSVQGLEKSEIIENYDWLQPCDR